MSVYKAGIFYYNMYSKFTEQTNVWRLFNMYVVWGNIFTYTFDTYREAEIFCGEHGIPCKEIYEVD